MLIDYHYEYIKVVIRFIVWKPKLSLVHYMQYRYYVTYKQTFDNYAPRTSQRYVIVFRVLRARCYVEGEARPLAVKIANIR